MNVPTDLKQNRIEINNTRRFEICNNQDKNAGKRNNDRNIIRGYYQNVNGLRTKINEFSMAVSLADYDFLILTESNLCDKIGNGELALSRYDVYRCDRSIETSSRLSGGGVLIAIKRKYKSQEIVLNINSVEEIFIEVLIGNSKLVIGGVYLPPNLSIDNYTDHTSTVEYILENCDGNCKLLLVGDYNLPNITWTQANEDCLGLIPCGNNSDKSEQIIDSFSYLNLNQFNNVPNHLNRNLDLVFSNFPVSVMHSPDVLVIEDRHHPALDIEFNLALNNESLASNFNYHNFDNGNYIGFNNFLASYSWDNILNTSDVNRAVNIFYSVIYEGIEMFIPISHYKDPSFPKWFSDELKACVLQKKAAHLLFKKSNSSQDYYTFSRLRAKCKQLSKTCYNVYLNSIKSKLYNNPKSFWDFIKSKTKSDEIPSTVHYNNITANDGPTIANTFANHFSSVYKKTQGKIPTFKPTLPINFSSCSISRADIFNKLEHITCKKSFGPDGIPPILLNQCRFILTEPLYILFNVSLKKGIFPDRWKTSYITPMFKSGDKANVKDYRGICKQSLIPKLFESIITDKITTLFKPIITDQQHGFISGRSTCSNLLVFWQFLLESVEQHCQVDCIYTDFAKAFDLVDHKILVAKLRTYGIQDPFLSWVSSFLEGRTQIVKIRNFLSEPIAVHSGVPQGSHISPLLFLVFINDITTVFKYSKVLLFADDAKFFLKIHSIEDCRHLQEDLWNLEEYCASNGLLLNESKCKLIRFSKRKSNREFPYAFSSTNILEATNSIHDLGATLSSDLTFNYHINAIVSKSLRTLGSITRYSKELCDPKIFFFLYITLVRPILEYCTPVWSPINKSLVDRIEKVQHKFLRIYAYQTGQPIVNHNYFELMCKLSLPTLKSRRDNFDIIYLYNIITSRIDCSELLSKINIHVPSHSTRNHYLFNTNWHSTKYGFNSPIDRMMRLSNSIDVDFFNTSLQSLRRFLNSRQQFN